MAASGQPMFVRGLGATSRLIIWLLVGLALVALDSRYHALEGLRASLALVTQPLRHAARAPFEMADEIAGFLARHRALQRERDALLQERAELRAEINATRDLVREHSELRRLAALGTRPDLRGVAASVLYQGQDWFDQRLTLDRGGKSSLRAGLPVVGADGLIGQIGRVYAASSEVTLVTNRDQLTPVFIERTGQRGLVAGSGRSDLLELRHMTVQTDVREGDRLLTSGVDRVYPAGIPVARVTRVSRSPANPYLRIDCLPLAGIDRDRVVLVLMPVVAEEKP